MNELLNLAYPKKYICLNVFSHAGYFLVDFSNKTAIFEIEWALCDY